MDITRVFIIWFSNWRIIRRISITCRFFVVAILWESFGLASPITLDLNIVELTFGLMFKINVASIIGMVIAIFIYRKV